MDVFDSRTVSLLYRMLRFVKKALETHTQTHMSYVVGLNDKMSSVFGTGRSPNTIACKLAKLEKVHHI